MLETITIKEYDKLYIKPSRDLAKHIISENDARHLQSVVIDNNPVFSFGNRCLIAQQFVGIIQLPEYSIEILPKLYGEVSTEDLRKVLVRMLMVSHQTSAIRNFHSSVSMASNSLVEMLIETFLRELELYIYSGLQNDYVKKTSNLDKIKGRILIHKQLNKNLITPTRFYCSYSSYELNNPLNQFFKKCLEEMLFISRDYHNRKKIEEFLPWFSNVETVTRDAALSFNIVFSSINIRAKESYIFGKMFLEGLRSTLSSGINMIYTMLFDMNELYELFVYRVMRILFGNRVVYQRRSAYMLQRNDTGRKHINLRPDIVVKANDDSFLVIDTKWKLPNKFVQESDAYQMYAYSTVIEGVKNVILLYPKTVNTDSFAGYYTFLSAACPSRSLEIHTIDVMKCLNWTSFLNEMRDKFEKII